MLPSGVGALIGSFGQLFPGMPAREEILAGLLVNMGGGDMLFYSGDVEVRLGCSWVRTIEICVLPLVLAQSAGCFAVYRWCESAD